MADTTINGGVDSTAGSGQNAVGAVELVGNGEGALFDLGNFEANGDVVANEEGGPIVAFGVDHGNQEFSSFDHVPKVNAVGRHKLFIDVVCKRKVAGKEKNASRIGVAQCNGFGAFKHAAWSRMSLLQNLRNSQKFWLRSRAASRSISASVIVQPVSSRSEYLSESVCAIMARECSHL